MMKNREMLKKYLIISALAILIFAVLLFAMNMCQYRIYTKNFNVAIMNIMEEVKTKYPKADINSIIENLNDVSNNKSVMLDKYGIDLEKDSVVLKNEYDNKVFVIIDITFIFVSSSILILIFIIYDNKKNKEIKEITKYIEQINKRNYKLDIENNTEDELSILKNEIYKTTVMLKEQALNSTKDKVKLKDSLSDISHQLKTPLTSITIMLDNIIDNPQMDEKTRIRFIKKIYKEIANINFLVQSILKLSKFDANTIMFVNKKENIKDIISKSIENISMIADLKNVTIEVKNNEDIFINCDFNWQVEAISNIIKNCVEHSKLDGVVSINYESSKLYKILEIQDNGEGIDKEDIRHIFDRFYKGKNSSKDSIGIGLSLSKTILEKNNATIGVTSEKGYGTRFSIKYWE